MNGNLFGRCARRQTRPRGLSLPGVLLILTLAVGCAEVRHKPFEYAATGSARIDRSQPSAMARSRAIIKAEMAARSQVLNQVAQKRLADGSTLGDLAAIDPYVRASLKDIVRSAQATHPPIGEDGSVTVRVQLEPGPLDRLIEASSRHSLKPARQP